MWRDGATHNQGSKNCVFSRIIARFYDVESLLRARFYFRAWWSSKNGIAVEDREIAESLRLHRVKNQATRKRKICKFETTRLSGLTQSRSV
ncbi:hypothetical protein PIB30_017889, partial [Stylosanthes scabra]|nr:hypothetical protein [Stylosanthes scabra]